MRRQRATTADHLSQVIEVIELGRRTGLLSVERRDRAGQEEGDIYFVQGEAIYASTGTKTGQIALEALRRWGACRFAFLTDVPRPTPNIATRPRGSQAFSGPPRPWQDAVPGSLPGREASGYTLPRMPQAPGGWPSAWPPAQPQETAPLLALNAAQRPKCAPNPHDIPRLAASYRLSLAHRAILLLADGEHTAAELARLAGRSEEETLRLLSDLWRLGLITLLS